jgi:hypothetical protein
MHIRMIFIFIYLHFNIANCIGEGGRGGRSLNAEAASCVREVSGVEMEEGGRRRRGCGLLEREGRVEMSQLLRQASSPSQRLPYLCTVVAECPDSRGSHSSGPHLLARLQSTSQHAQEPLYTHEWRRGERKNEKRISMLYI